MQVERATQEKEQKRQDKVREALAEIGKAPNKKQEERDLHVLAAPEP